MTVTTRKIPATPKDPSQGIATGPTLPPPPVTIGPVTAKGSPTHPTIPPK